VFLDFLDNERVFLMKKKIGLGCAALFAAFLFCIVALTVYGSTLPSKPTHVVSTRASTAPTSAPTQVHKPAWTTVANFSGNGSKKTATFRVPDEWKIVWKCDHSSFQGYDYNVIILVYNSDGTLADSGINTLCSKSNEHGETEIRTAGNVYLDVTSEALWSVQIQELK